MLFAECSCATGMALVAALLSPSGTQNNTRATAGISFICESPLIFLTFKANACPQTCSWSSTLSVGQGIKPFTLPKSCLMRSGPRLLL